MMKECNTSLPHLINPAKARNHGGMILFYKSHLQSRIIEHKIDFEDCRYIMLKIKASNNEILSLYNLYGPASGDKESNPLK